MISEGITATATILVADDEAAVRRLLGTILSSRGHRVVLAADAEEALRLAARETVDLLVTDVMAPGGGGRELAGRLARSGQRVPVLFVSGSIGDGVVPAEDGESPTAFLAKPFGAGDLLSRVEGLLAAGGPAAARTGRREKPC